jgi:hypothetical protein
MHAYLDAVIKEKDGPAYTMPCGITIVAPLFDEAAALTAGLAQKHRWRLRSPTGTNVRTAAM